ncbi:hypothetical protein AcW1_000800 [Taiwanofungus camphoratus]|nr:hypothetical protein AcW2_000698 [Antrodia cinnamomea]KAI0961823.1 hypothetical protein AcV7_000820 [Antrodia cinnamomea]KAI0963833.1 hypothetical protein AcW1_000800 [Antrodia cinnamomea]
MDSSISAEAMLAEIEVESLQHFLTAIRSETSAPGTTQIPALDTHLATGIPTFQRSQLSLKYGDVIEIQGPAACGKSHLLYHLLMTCIIPSNYRSINLGGWDKAAVLFDTDGTFNIGRFQKLLVSRLSRSMSLATHSDKPSVTSQFASLPVEDLASHCLTRLHIFRPTSSFQLAATLLHLPTYHSTTASLQSVEIGILAIDSLSAFYWKDRFALEQIRSTESSSGPSVLAMGSSSGPLHHVLTALQKFRVSHGPVMVMTNWGLNPLRKPLPTGEPASPFYKQHLYPFPSPFEGLRSSTARSASHPGAFNSQSLEYGPDASSDGHRTLIDEDGFEAFRVDRALPLTHHITLYPLPIHPFASIRTLAEAQNAEPLRSVVVKEGQVLGLVRTPGTARVGEFSFCIGKRDIVTDLQHISVPSAETYGS